MKNFIQKMTYADGTTKEIRRGYEEMLDIKRGIEDQSIEGVQNYSRKNVLEFSFDRYNIHYDFYLADA